MRQHQTGTAALVVAALALAGCGVPTQDHPRVVERDDVPFDLTQDVPPTTPPESSPPR
jgi:hypothetical protein